MKLLIAFLLLVLTLNCKGQVVSSDKIFSSSDIEKSSMVYATANLSNAIAIWEEEYNLNFLLAKALNVYRKNELEVDIYQPKDNVDRPALIFIHGGAFLPGGGSKDDDSVQFIAKEFAQRGFRVFCIEYRLMNLLTPSFVKAGYTAAQDGKAAVRFVANHHADLNVDIDNIFVAGISAGGVTALNTVFLENGEDVLGRERKLEKMYGHLDGVGEDSFVPVRIKGVVSLSGGVFSPEIIEDSQIPLMLFHGTEDDVVQIECGLPFISMTKPYNKFMVYCKDLLSSYPKIVAELEEGKAVNMCGSREIHEYCELNGLYSEIREYNGADHYLLLSKNGTPTRRGEEIIMDMAVFLEKFVD